MAHRIDIPAELGGGWVDIKDKISWSDSNRLSVAAVQIRNGVLAGDVNASSQASEVVDINMANGIALELELTILATSPGLMGDHIAVREWLDSDDLDMELGDFLLGEVRGYYAARRRSKSGAVADQSGAGRDESAVVPSGPRALRDSDMGEGVPA